MLTGADTFQAVGPILSRTEAAEEATTKMGDAI